MNLVTITLGELVDNTLNGLQGPAEIGRRIVLNTTIDASVTTYQVSDATLVNVTDILEFAAELHFVTAKSNDTATATLTVVRGYAGSVAVGHTVGLVGTINPRFSRRQTQLTVRQAFTYLEANRLPLVISSGNLTPLVDPINAWQQNLEVPAEARYVYMVRWGTEELPGWDYIEDLPVASYPTGKVVRLPRGARVITDPFTIVYRLPYRWSVDPPVEASTIQMIEGSTDVPAAYAIWQLVSDRETSRRQIDRSEEWPNRLNGESGLALVRLKRDEFYASLDAARRLNPPPRRRQWVGKPRLGRWWC